KCDRKGGQRLLGENNAWVLGTVSRRGGARGWNSQERKRRGRGKKESTQEGGSGWRRGILEWQSLWRSALRSEKERNSSHQHWRARRPGDEDHEVESARRKSPFAARVLEL